MSKCAHCLKPEVFKEVFADKIPLCLYCFNRYVKITEVEGIPVNEYLKFLRKIRRNLKKWSDEN